jgi:hypothetical protein
MEYITARVNLNFPLLCIRSMDGNSAVLSRHTSAMNGPVAKLNKIFFFRKIVYELVFPNVVA